MYGFFRVCPIAAAHRVRVSDTASSRANRLIELARAKPVEEPPVHPFRVQQPHIAVEAVRKNALRPVLGDQRFPLARNHVDRFFPADRLELALALGADPLQRLLQPVRIVQPFGHMAHLVADAALRNRVVRIAFYFNDFAVLLMNEQPALIGAIEGTNGWHNPVPLLDILVHCANLPVYCAKHSMARLAAQYASFLYKWVKCPRLPANKNLPPARPDNTGTY
ncbi:hypothetical protein D3C84_855780 [compost metagenome]